MRRVLLALALCASALPLVHPGPAAAVVDPPFGQLNCDKTDDINLANGVVRAMGSPEQAAVQRNIFIPVHEDRCPDTVGKVQYTEAPEQQAITALQYRRESPVIGAKPDLFIGVNQPLTTAEWANAVLSQDAPVEHVSIVYHLPLMMDGFVVTANIQCANPGHQPLKLTPQTLGLIYAGAVTRWGHQALLADNTWLTGCSQPIVVGVHKGDAWSNAVFKDYVSKGVPAFLPYKERDRLASWPSTLDVGCRGDTEADMVGCASLSGAVSYMRYTTAKTNGLTPVLLTNGKGQTPPPAVDPADLWPSGCTAAVPNGQLTSPQQLLSPQTLQPAAFLADWSTFSMTYGDAGYPMCGMSFVVCLNEPPQGTHYTEKNAWKDHFHLMWADAWQDALTGEGYAPIPGSATDGAGIRGQIWKTLVMQ